MRKHRSAILIVFVLLAASTAACDSNTKMVKRFTGGTATLTPFALKATYTRTPTPGENPGEDVVISGTFTATSDPTALEGTSELVTTDEPSLTPSFTLTPGINSPTVSAPGSLAVPSATTKAADPADTPKPSATTKPSQTPDHSADTSTPDPPTATYTPQPPTLTTVPPATQTPDGCTFSGNATYENQVVVLINQERTNRGLPALGQNSSLQQAARRHSEDMACNDIFSHTGSDGSTLSSRLLEAGYSYSWAAENIAASSSSSFSASAVVSMWMNSPGHKANILSENVTQVGVGFRYAGDSAAHDFDAYYTADFGQPR